MLTVKAVSVMLRRWMKNAVSTLFLAPYYHICCLRPVQKGFIVLADGHSNHMPYSMEALAKRLGEIEGVTVAEFFRDYSFVGPRKGLRIMLDFIPLYARAEYVFISDCFIPSAACRKRPQTTLIQLWHSGGLMKKVGIHSPEEKASMMKNLYRNTDVFTASSQLVSDVLSEAMMIPRQCFVQAGVTRMDLLYQTGRTDRIRQAFLAAHPEYAGKKIVLWAPTFRGNVHSGYLVGTQEILRLRDELAGHGIAIIPKMHRFLTREVADAIPDFTSNDILTFADALITDYSSIYFDYLYFRRPIVLFAPDLEEYQEKRGLYPNYRDLPGYFAQSYGELFHAMTTLDCWANDDYRARLDQLWASDMAYCDGHSTDKLLHQLGILQFTEDEL